MKVPVRFFKYDYNENNEVDTIEISEKEFLNTDGEIQYERHTVFENVVSQICLTKTNNFI